jgi:two-component system response regulator AtoC
MNSLLIIEDADLMRESLEETFRRAGYRCAAFPEGKPALEALRHDRFHAVLCDMKLPGMSGLEILEEILRLQPDLPVVLITAYATVETAVEAMKKGAFDYVTKPFRAEEIELVVRRAIAHQAVVAENERLRAERESEPEFVLGPSPAMRSVFETLQRAAASDATVLLSGESGTGKEVAARALHRLSPRHDKPFLCVNCAALSAGLLESELFGHEKGAFTGADRARKGRFELADTGTLLLDEVSEIDPHLQAKLLRVLQEKTFERVGSSLTRTADVRVVATTNRDLADWVRQGKFREDLFFRLNVLPIALPPLRERPEDVPALARHFLDRFAARGAPRKTVSPAALELLRSYPWPGNARELGNILERACVLAPGPDIRPDDIAGWLQAPAPAGHDDGLAGLTLREMEKKMIADALRRFQGSRQKTARALGIAERTLREKIRRWELAG